MVNVRVRLGFVVDIFCRNTAGYRYSISKYTASKPVVHFYFLFITNTLANWGKPFTTSISNNIMINIAPYNSIHCIYNDHKPYYCSLFGDDKFTPTLTIILKINF